MTNRDFDRISRPERDALNFIQRQMGELALVKTRVVDIMAAQMARDIRSNAPGYMDTPEDEAHYRSALELAREWWGEILS